MNVLILTIFLSILLVAFFIILLIITTRKGGVSHLDQDALLPLQPDDTSNSDSSPKA